MENQIFSSVYSSLCINCDAFFFLLKYRTFKRTAFSLFKMYNLTSICLMFDQFNAFLQNKNMNFLRTFG